MSRTVLSVVVVLGAIALGIWLGILHTQASVTSTSAEVAAMKQEIQSDQAQQASLSSQVKAQKQQLAQDAVALDKRNMTLQYEPALPLSDVDAALQTVLNWFGDMTQDNTSAANQLWVSPPTFMRGPLRAKVDSLQVFSPFSLHQINVFAHVTLLSGNSAYMREVMTAPIFELQRTGLSSPWRIAKFDFGGLPTPPKPWSDPDHYNYPETKY